MRDHINLTRKLSGFHGRSRPPVIEIQAFDSALVSGLSSKPKAPIVGSLIVPEDVRQALGETDVADAIVRWIRAGEAPVLYGFGSMPVGDPRTVLQMIERIVRERRGLARSSVRDEAAYRPTT